MGLGTYGVLINYWRTFRLKSIEPLLEIVSKQFSPTQAQYVIGPLLTSLTGEALTEFVFATTLADYVQLLLKW